MGDKAEARRCRKAAVALLEVEEESSLASQSPMITPSAAATPVITPLAAAIRSDSWHATWEVSRAGSRRSTWNARRAGSRRETWSPEGLNDLEVRRTWRDTLADLLERPESSFGAKAVHFALILVIVSSTISVAVETMPEFHMNPMFFMGEVVTTAIFTVEFALRLYICDSLCEFAGNYYNVLDLFATLPGYFEMVRMILCVNHLSAAGQQADLGGEEWQHMDHVHKAAGYMRTARVARLVRLMKVFRVLRIAKVMRHSKAFSVMIGVFLKVSKAGLIVVIIMMVFAMILSSSVTYIFELESCEDAGRYCEGPSSFESILSSCWWAISTLSTVGYGDMVPRTAAGKIVGSATCIVGVIVLSVGVALVSVNFRECVIEEQALEEQRDRGYDDSMWRTEEEDDEIQDLLEEFDARSAMLLTKLGALAAQREHDTHLAMTLDVLTSHTNVWTSDVKSFIDTVIPPKPGFYDQSDDNSSAGPGDYLH